MPSGRAGKALKDLARERTGGQPLEHITGANPQATDAPAPTVLFGADDDATSRSVLILRARESLIS